MDTLDTLDTLDTVDTLDTLDNMNTLVYVQQRQRDTTRARCLFAFLVMSLTKFNQQEIKF